MVTVIDNAAGLEPAHAQDGESSPVMAFVLAELRANPEISFPELKARAELNKLHVYPVQYGRAKVILGLVPAKIRVAKNGGGKPTTGLLPGIVEQAPEPKAVEPDLGVQAAPSRGRPLGPRDDVRHRRVGEQCRSAVRRGPGRRRGTRNRDDIYP